MKNQNNRLLTVKFLDGEEFQTDGIVLFEKADFLAFNYGIGNCRNLSDFVKMIDDEDPVVLNGLLYAACIRIQASHGIENERTQEDSDDIENVVQTTQNVSTPKKILRVGDSKEMLLCFLRDFGATEEDIKIATEKLKTVEVPEEDFSWITPEILARSDFDLRGVLSRMSDCYKRSVNVNVSLDKLMGKRKKNG
jgi:hypothetical protein